jgi:hypothetical protein
MVDGYQVLGEHAASNLRVDPENQYFIYHETSQCHFPDDSNLHSSHHESLKCGKCMLDPSLQNIYLITFIAFL